jgi:hypothetical protein
VRGMFREICTVCNIDISGRNISNHSGRGTSIQSIFDSGHEEIEAMSISGHNSSSGIRNYLKVTSEKKRNILTSVIQKLTKTEQNIKEMEEAEESDKETVKEIDDEPDDEPDNETDEENEKVSFI